MKRIKRYVFGAFFGLILSGCGKQTVEDATLSVDSAVVALVGETQITLSMLERIAAQNAYNLSNPEEAEFALRDAINFELLAVEAKKAGYTQHPDILHYVKSQSVQRLLQDRVDQKSAAVSSISDEDLRTYYEANLSEFTPPAMARARVLGLLRRGEDDTAFEQKLDALQTAIRTNQVTFAEMVQQFSDDPAARAYGGLTSWLVEGRENKRYPDSLLEVVFSESTETEDIHGPIVHNSWTYYVQVHEKRGGATEAFETAKARIAQQILRKQRLERYDTFVKSLESGVAIQTFPETLSEGLSSKRASSGPPSGPVTLK